MSRTCAPPWNVTFVYANITRQYRVLSKPLHGVRAAGMLYLQWSIYSCLCCPQQVVLYRVWPDAKGPFAVKKNVMRDDFCTASQFPTSVPKPFFLVGGCQGPSCWTSSWSTREARMVERQLRAKKVDRDLFQPRHGCHNPHGRWIMRVLSDMTGDTFLSDDCRGCGSFWLLKSCVWVSLLCGR